MDTKKEQEKLAVFRQKEVRRKLHHGEWWFVITDVIVALTDSVNPNQYLKNIRRRDAELADLFDPVDKGRVQIDPPLGLGFNSCGNGHLSEEVR